MTNISVVYQNLKNWALSSASEADLERIFGQNTNWATVYKYLSAFRKGDFSLLPPITVLPASDMPELWGGYSRNLGRIFISEDCPSHLQNEILLEEIGHFLDQELCSEETPGDEGVLFANLVLKRNPEPSQLREWATENSLYGITFQGRSHLVEAATINKRKIIIGQSPGPARLIQTGPGDLMVGTAGNDTFVVNNADISIQDPKGGNDTVEASVSFSLLNLSFIENLTLTGTGNINGTGNFNANYIIGNAGNNLIDGQSGNDTLLGGNGNDTLLGGSGNDFLDGGLGNDILDGGAGIDTLVGGIGNDTYYVDNLLDIVREESGGGTDTIITSNRNITLLTYANIENIVYTGGGGSGGGGVNTLGDQYDNLLWGDSVANTLSGLAGSDTLDAKGGNDYLDGGVGNDSMLGGAGNDTYIVDSSGDLALENSNEGTDLVISSVSYSLGNNLENLTLNSTLPVASANINGTGNSIANLITGNAGNNQLDGGGGADTLRGGDGNDILNGGTGDGVGDLLEGGAGNDYYIVDSTLDVIRDSSGVDTVESKVSFDIGDTLRVEGIEHLLYKGSNTAATLKGNNGDNSLISQGTGNDTLIGGAGNDTLDGGTGANSLAGGTGDDYYIVNSSSDKIYEDSLGGLDTILTKAASFALDPAANIEVITYDSLGTSKTTLTGSNSDNTIKGGNFGNILSGLGGDDYLIGGVKSDTLLGGNGNDTLDGRGGVDSLIGGTGDDYYFTDSQTVNILEDTAPGGGKDTVRSSVTFSLSYSSKLAGIEGLYLTGSASLSGTGNSLANTITGNDGNNFLSGKLGNDTIQGGLGADYITGDEGNDFIVGGGDIQGDVPANASTPILMASGQTYTGQINSSNETDWIKADLQIGVTYHFAITSQLFGAQILKDRSDVAFGAQGSDALGYPAIGDKAIFGHSFLVLNSDGSNAYGYIDTSSWLLNTSSNIIGFDFTPFESGTFYIPVSGAGPALGSYSVTLTDPNNPSSVTPALADNASNTLMGGLGADTLISGNGRDNNGNALGDILLGGTNGRLGSVDTDSSGDTLIGGDGDDSLDGGNGANSLIGGKGNDYYYIRSANDKVVEQIDGGTADAMIVNFSAKLGDQWDIVLNPDYTPTGPAFQANNIEYVTLTGSANTSVLGSSNSDKIVGNFGNNTIDGGVGDDTLYGQGGNDYLIGGDGSDTLDGGSGVNTMDGGYGADYYIVNDRNDRVINEQEGLDGGEDIVLTYFNFDPIQGLDGNGYNTFAPNLADFSPSITKSPSFASRDLSSFYALENFVLLGDAVYGVGNALDNSITAGSSDALLIGNGGEDYLLGGAGDDSLFGDTPDFYGTPDLYASAAKDTITKEFLLKIIGKDADNDYNYVTTYSSDYLNGGAGNNYLDGGRGFDTMIGGAGDDTFIQDNVDDYIVAGGGMNELVTSVNIDQAPDGISKIMLVVAKQSADSGQSEVASFASFLGTKSGNNRNVNITTGGITLSLTGANILEVMYAPREGQVFGSADLLVGLQEDDLSHPGKFQYDLSWTAGVNAATDLVGYVVKYKRTDITDDIWHTYVNGKSQDFQGTQTNPILTVNNLDDGTYDFQVTAIERTIPALQDRSAAQYVTLQGGAGNDAVIGQRLQQPLAGGLLNDGNTDPLLLDNPNLIVPIGFIFNPAPYNSTMGTPNRFASYLDGGYGNDLLIGDFVNDSSGDDYVFQGVTFHGLNTMVGGQGSDTFVVKNGGTAIGDEFDWVVKYGNETPVNYGSGGVGASLNGGKHNLVVSRVDFLTLSDEIVSQGKFIDQLALAGIGQFGQGNRLDNYIYDTGGFNTLVGDKGRDSIVGAGSGDILIGGTAYGLDQVGLAIKDFSAVSDGGNGLTNSIFRDTDPIPVSPNGPGIANPSKFWFVPGYYGGVYDPNRNQDTLVANAKSTLDGGAGRDSMVGSTANDMFYVSQGSGDKLSHNIGSDDAVFGNGGNDTITFTDSDYLWWSGHQEDTLLDMHTYTLASDISNLVLQMGSPTARNGVGNRTSTGVEGGLGSNLIVGNEFDNILDGYGVGGQNQTGTGIDTLTGGLGDDYFNVGSSYRASTSNVWSPTIVKSAADPITGLYTFTWNKGASEYKDYDFVIITDFEAGDILNLSGNLSEYSIGNVSSDLKTPGGDVGSKGKTLTANSFGIYYTGTTYGNTNPNLVAVIQSADTNLLAGIGGIGSLTARPSVASPQTNLTGVTPAAPFGWDDGNDFYQLAGSNFATHVNQTYIQQQSTASLSALMGQIV